MKNIYLPIEDFNSYSCYVIYNKDTIRAYKNNPIIGENTYTDFFINSHYLQSSGVQIITDTIELPVCVSSDVFTNKSEYRNDFSHILIIILFFLIIIYFSYKIFSRLFGRWLKI